MRKEKKKEAVSQLAEKFSRCNIAITTNYRGLSVAEMTELRRRLRQGGIEYRVIKNTLARFAAKLAGKEGLNQIIEGPTAIAFGYSNVTEPAKALIDYIRSSRGRLTIRGGLLGQRVLTASEVTDLATLPPKEVLMAKVLGAMQGPISALVNVLNSTLVGIVGMLNARIRQLEGG
jgi:large subunit ribosomal protein L10